MAQEVELKLILAPQDVDAFTQHPIFAQFALENRSNGQSYPLANQYFDTADQALTRFGIALRIRQKQDQWLQTLKGKGTNVGGLHQRLELEWPLETAMLDLSLIPKEHWPDQVNAQDIQSLFNTQFQRTEWTLEYGQSIIEVVLDQGEVSRQTFGGAKTDAICEVELELKQGNPLDLFTLALAFAEDVPLVPSDISKAERGYRLVNRTSGAWTELPLVEKDQSVEATFINVMAFEFESLQRQWEAFHYSENWKHLHGFRNTLSNIRTHFLLFANMLPPKGLAKAEGALDWLEERLNPILSWWPACYALSRQASEPPRSASEQLQQAKAQQALLKLQELERQPKFGHCLLTLSEWLHGRQWQSFHDDHTDQNGKRSVGEAILEPLKEQWQSLNLVECGGNASEWITRQPMIQGLTHVCQTLENVLGVDMIQMRQDLRRMESNLVELSAMDVIHKLGDWLQRLSLDEKQSVNSWTRGQTVIMRDLNVLANKLMSTL